MLSEATPHIAETKDEEMDILCWRYEQFVQLGYSPVVAHALAESEADLGIARRLRGRGCEAELALQILL